MKDRFFKYIHELQDTITSKLEMIDGSAVFKEDIWKRPEGGGGRTRVIENGTVFEKGGVNVSAVHGKLPDTMQQMFKVVEAEGEIAMASTTVTVVRQMENDPRNVVGKEGELRLLQSEMRNELADKILRRIGFYASNLGNTAADSTADVAPR